MTASWTRDRAASELLRAERDREERGPISDEWREFDLRDAYAIQDETLSRRIARGEHLTGVKLGLTSRAKQERMNVRTPLTAWLTDVMALPAGVPLPRDTLIHPRIEPEIVFVLGQRLKGPGITATTAMTAVERVYAGVEVIDSRYRDFRFTLPDVVADNASAARYIIRPQGLPPEALDLSLEACSVEVDGQVIDTATGSAVQGHPAEALALAANSLAERGLALEAGWLVLTGGMTDAVALEPGSQAAVSFTTLGTIMLSGGRRDADR